MRRGVQRGGVGMLALAMLVGAIPAASADDGCAPIGGATPLLETGRVVLLGELHGTEQSPAFVASLACHAVAAGLDLVVGLY